MIYEFFNVNTVIFTVLGYPLSYIEFFGTILNIWCVWLVARKSILNWPIGIAGVILFLILFYQIQLYSDFFEQIYFLITGLYGWMVWSRYGYEKNGSGRAVYFGSLSANLLCVVGIGIGTLGLGYFMSHIHSYWPTLFPTPASFPYLDALTTVMSFAAQLLLIWRRIESWVLWIGVDVIGIWLYNIKDVKFIALLYVVFLFLAIQGFIFWLGEWKKEQIQKRGTKTSTIEKRNEII